MRRLAPAAALALIACFCGQKQAPPVGHSPGAAPAANAAARYLALPADARRAPIPARTGRRVILIGWDSADWNLLDPLMAQGQMPNLRRLVTEGRTAELESYMGMVSPLVWTTIATGAEPQDHGVLDFFEFDPSTGRRVPISAQSRRVPAWWTIASDRGQSVGVVSWWATYPAEQVDGFMVSDRACPTLTDPVPAELPSAVYPPSLAAGVSEILARVPIPDAAVLRHFGRFTDAELASQQGWMLARLVRSTRANEEIAERLYDRQRPRSMALYFLGSDAISHLYGKEASPRLPCVSQDIYDRLSTVVPRYYAWLDEYLGRWMTRAQQSGADLLIVSDHGFKWGNKRPCWGNPLQLQSATFSHELYGMAAAWGKNVVPDSKRLQASVFDIEPTLAALLDLPVDRKEKGQPLLDWFRHVPSPPREDLWAKTPPPRHLPRVFPAGTNEYAERLKALGYLAGAEAPVEAAPGGKIPGRTEIAWLNLGAYQDSDNQIEEAVRSFREGLRIRPGQPALLVNLVQDLIRLHRNDEAVQAAMTILDHPSERQGWAIYDISWVLDGAGLKDAEERLLLAARAKAPSSEPVVVSLAGLRLNQGRCAEALDLVRPFVPRSDFPDTFNVAGFALDCMHRTEESRQLLRRSLALNPGQPYVRRALGMK
jgi:predicted AlkP superfamily phosphohydrolase/phosphomutase